jgi:Fe-S-cluster containining protein
MPERSDGDLGTLCRSCGLCCDGSLFDRVGLGPDEVEPARRNRLRVLESGKGFEQPCRALGRTGGALDENCVCSIYDERPLSCRAFACRLYERHRTEGGALEPRLAAVRRVRELVAALKSEGLTPADFDCAGSPRSRPGVHAREMFEELTRRIEEDFARA